MSVALLKVSYFHNKPRHPSSACSKELVQQWTMYVNNCNIWHLTKVLLLSSSNNMAACVCTCTCKNQKIFPSTESPTLTHTHTHAPFWFAEAGLKYSTAVTHEEKFLIINIQPIMNVLLAAVVLGA